MWEFFKSLGNYIFQLFTKVGSVKFIVFTAMYWLLTKLFEMGKALILPYSTFFNLDYYLSSLPNDFRFYLVLFKIDWGLPIILAAYVARFAIRRLPFIG